MPIRRSVLSAFCMLMLGSASLHGQENDPFAEWDRLHPRKTSARTAETSPKTNVAYFSPETKESATPNDKVPVAAKAARVPMRERSQPGTAEFGTSQSRNKVSQSSVLRDGTAANLSPATETKPPFAWLKNPPTSDLPRTVASGKSEHKSLVAPKSAGVRHAYLDAEERDPADEKIILTNQKSAPEFSEPAEEENPFVNFLKESRQPAAETESVKSFEETLRQDDSAEAIFNPRSQSSRKTAATRSGAQAVTPSAADSKVNFGPQSPGVTVQWKRRGDFNVGQECDVDLVVQNTSKAVVRSVMTEAVIPPGVEMLEATPAPMQGNESPTWTFGEIQPGETRTVSMKMIPRQRGDVRLDAFVRLTGYSSAEYSVQEPMLSVTVNGPETAEVGDQIGYVVRVSNPGTGVASSIVIQAAVPAGLEHRSGSILSIEIGTLGPGESRQAKLSLAAVHGGPQKLAVRAIAEGGLNDETVVDVTIAEPNLKIAIAGPENQLAGRTGEYRMTVSNTGNIQSSNVRAKYRIPEGFEFVSADRGGKYNKIDHSIEWFVGTVRPEEASDFRLTLRATQPGNLVHQAGVISEHGQVTMCDYATAVEGMAALEMKIVSSSGQLTRGSEVTWEVHIRNTGSREATNVGMSCEIPSGFELVDAQGPSQHIAENGVMVFRSLPVIKPGTEEVYLITAHCLRSGNHQLRLRVASESIPEPLIGEESTSVSDR